MFRCLVYHRRIPPDLRYWMGQKQTYQITFFKCYHYLSQHPQNWFIHIACDILNCKHAATNSITQIFMFKVRKIGGQQIFSFILQWRYMSVIVSKIIDNLFNSLFRLIWGSIKCPHYWPFVWGIHPHKGTLWQTFRTSSFALKTFISSEYVFKTYDEYLYSFD